ncbi:transposable element Tc1 transposase [Trichonephila clavipes]|uniref:Transposable element Tc1 transposase n=1 Tax=Trichonephila clavipes TaxID=2585209 RepID=A0A8X6RDN0_TRICX|nr:transposable element Tc1 transposase [Trichonephila clavipes]
MMIPAYNKNRCAAFLSRRESITGERPISFLKKGNTTMSYLGFEAEPTRLQAEGHSHHTGWATEDFGKRNMPGKRARRHFSQLSEFERGLIIGMKTEGWSTHRVAGQVDRSECAVRNCWEQGTREGTLARKTGSGATRKTTRREDRRIVQQALVGPTVTLSTIRADVGVAIVPQTISRHLAEANLKSKRPFRALPLTPEHRQLRLQWCQARSMWNVTDWQKVVCSDQSRFILGTDDNRVRAWRLPARVAQDFLRHFQTLPWPARSPDLSPVEHVWDQLERQMPWCHSVRDLELDVQDLWAPLPPDNIRCLINSMPDRVAACIAAGGGPTRY